jgi:uncharacterized protein involved in response to NO
MAMPAALERRRNYAGPALLSYGFRPFFLLGAAWAACGVLLWLPQYFGELTLPIAMAPRDWHVHEMLYGYVAAVAAGFLLTAIPNWTGRLPVNGAPLAGLAALWIAGRLAILFSADIGLPAAACIDVAFLLTLALTALREIVAGGNWHNLRVIVVLGLLIAGNVVFHLEVLWKGTADYGTRLAVAAVIGLIMLIGGRIIPSFTRNWLARRTPGRLPVPFSRYDMAAIAFAALALALWCAVPGAAFVGAMLGVAVCCTWSASRDGLPSAHLPTAWSSCCMPATRSCRSASCSPRLRSCGRKPCRRAPASTPGPRARSR